MEISIRAFEQSDLTEITAIWNEVVAAANAFPQTDLLTPESARAFFAAQSFTGVARAEGRVVGLYILHPNNVGRCGHIANASYAVAAGARGLKIGEQLVRHSLGKGKELGFRILQFNAVVKSNTTAIRLYEKLGFTRVGAIPEGFLRGDGSYEDILIFYHGL